MDWVWEDELVEAGVRAGLEAVGAPPDRAGPVTARYTRGAGAVRRRPAVRGRSRCARRRHANGAGDVVPRGGGRGRCRAGLPRLYAGRHPQHRAPARRRTLTRSRPSRNNLPLSSLAAACFEQDNSVMTPQPQRAATLPLRPHDELECRRCDVHCDKVVYPSACLERACPFVYAYEEFGHTYVGCMQKVYEVEIDRE